MGKRLFVLIVTAICFSWLAGCQFDLRSIVPGASDSYREEITVTPAIADIESEPESESDPEFEPEPEPEPESEPRPQPWEIDFSMDESPAEPWRMAYIDFLERLCAEEAPLRGLGLAEEGALSSSYCLYDIDKDGVPELFIRFGNCEAAYMAEVYTYRDGTVANIGEFGFGHSGLYSWPGENAAIVARAHMGFQEMMKLSIRDGKIVFADETLLEEYINRSESSYTSPDEIAPGSECIQEYRTTLYLPVITPLTLPLYEYGHGGYPTGESSQAARQAITETLAGKRELFGISGDGFYGDTGYMSFEEYCRPGVVYEYARFPMVPRSYVWLDMNQDGQEECVIRLTEDGGEYPAQSYVVFSYQGSIVYAYALAYMDDYALGQNGTFYDDVYASYNDEYAPASRISFYKNQCYRDYTAAYDGGIPRVSWESYGDFPFPAA